MIFCRNAGDRASVRNVFCHNRIRSNDHVIAYCDLSQYATANSEHHPVSDNRHALFICSTPPCTANGDVVKEDAFLADDGITMEYTAQATVIKDSGWVQFDADSDIARK